MFICPKKWKIFGKHTQKWMIIGLLGQLFEPVWMEIFLELLGRLYSGLGQLFSGSGRIHSSLGRLYSGLGQLYSGFRFVIFQFRPVLFQFRVVIFWFRVVYITIYYTLLGPITN